MRRLHGWRHFGKTSQRGRADFYRYGFTKKQGQFLPERAAIKWARRTINKKNYNITDCILRKKYRFGKKDKKNIYKILDNFKKVYYIMIAVREKPRTNEQKNLKQKGLEMKNIETLIYQTSKNISDLTARMADYCDSTMYVCDAISEIVDCDCPIYWSDLMKWFNEPGTEDYINDAVNEYGIGRDGNFDIMRAIQCGWCAQQEERINEERDNGLLLAAWVLVRDNYKLSEISDEQTDAIENIDFPNIDTFTDLRDAVESIINGEIKGE